MGAKAPMPSIQLGVFKDQTERPEPKVLGCLALPRPPERQMGSAAREAWGSSAAAMKSNERRRPSGNNLFDRITIGRLRNEGGGKDARCQQKADDAAQGAPVR
jgi:hypothetical protein